MGNTGHLINGARNIGYKLLGTHYREKYKTSYYLTSYMIINSSGLRTSI